jgi:hypothetical protein
MGGKDNTSGNVFAFNPATGITGPVCDDYWDLEDVIVLFCFYAAKSGSQLLCYKVILTVPKLC